MVLGRDTLRSRTCIDVSAPWCPTCKAQHPILSRLEAEPKFKDLLVLNVDFGSRKDVLRALGGRMQSMLIAFKGDKETARSTGDTKAASISHLLDATCDRRWAGPCDRLMMSRDTLAHGFADAAGFSQF